MSAALPVLIFTWLIKTVDKTTENGYNNNQIPAVNPSTSQTRNEVETMSSQLIKDLLFNTALLLSISIVYNLFLIHLDSRKKWLEAVLGLFLGGVGILLMINTVSFANGIIFDTRSILISVTGLFLGYLPTVIAALLVSLYRLYLGGGGALTGVLVTATSAAIGLLWHRYRLPKIVKKSAQVWPELYLFGLLVHLVMLADMLTLPNAQGPAVL